VPPSTRYARSGDLHIAYQTIGDGPIDLVLVDQWFSNVDAMWEFPPLERLLTQLSSFSRLIVVDKRGTGLSDPVAVDALPTIEEWIDDLRAVLDDVKSTRTALLSGTGASYMTLTFAATYPDRTSALVLVDPTARLAWAEDNNWGRRPELLPADLERIRSTWGIAGGTMNFLAPNLLEDRVLAEQYNRYERHSTGPGAARAMIGLLYGTDVRDILPTITVPALVLNHSGATRVSPAHGRYVAEHVRGARYVEIAGSENYVWAGDTATLVAEIQEFLTGVRPAPEPDRVLATVLFTDIVNSTGRAAELGDKRWRALLREHDDEARRAIDRFRGRAVKTTGDGVLATFDGPARAVRCAVAIRDAMAARGVELRAGLHAGEIELSGDDIAGIGVHIAARISALAESGEVIVSSTVRDLVVGSGIEFAARGTHRLKGVPGSWRLFATQKV
jgi:class 3 adenylate cyclase